MVAGDPYGLWPSWSSVKSGVSDFASGAGDFLDSAVDKVNTYGPAVTGALSVASIAFPPLAPIALTAGAITAGAAAYTATQTCLGNIKGSCSGAIGNAAISTALGVGAGAALARVARLGTSIPRTAARSCSFSGDTTVLMADGTQKPIKDIKVGDKVLATDPETGEQAPKSVTHVWVHEDTLVDLEVNGEVITTTEDHPFWSATDQRFERADQLANGEEVIRANGRLAEISRLNFATARGGLAYNLTVAEIHTYHVGGDEVLVHNTCSLTSRAARREAMRGAGIPTSAQPFKQLTTPAGRSYSYRVDGKLKVVSQQTTDRVAGHGPHWEAGTAKLPVRLDGLGRVRVYNDKTKVNYGE